jgi:hypothetical protein
MYIYERPSQLYDGPSQVKGLEGPMPQAHGFEMAVPLEYVNKVVDVILSVAAEWNSPDKTKHDRRVFISPFSLHFVNSGPQFIGTNGRERVGAPPSDAWCFMEISRLWIHGEKEKKREFPCYPDAAVRSIWQTCGPFGVRSHWGQQEFMVASGLPALYPNLAAWQAQAARLDPERKFANARALQIGLRKGWTRAISSSQNVSKSIEALSAGTILPLPFPTSSQRQGRVRVPPRSRGSVGAGPARQLGQIGGHDAPLACHSYLRSRCPLS